MKKLLFLLLLVIVFFTSKGVKANNDPYEDHYDGYKINYISETSINLKWDTNCPTNENFYYKAEGSSQENHIIANCYEKPFSSDKECQMVLNNLSTMSKYFFSNRCGNQSYNFENFFVTLRKLNDSNVKVSNLSHDSATIKWTTNNASRSKVYYFPENNTFDQNTISSDVNSLIHDIKLTGLIPNTKYKYKVTSSVVGGGLISDYLYFTTLDSPSVPVSLPDLTVTNINFSESTMNEVGILSVTIKNLGDDLNNTAGLLSWYNNFSSQNFVFSSQTPSITNFNTSRSLPNNSNPLKEGDSIVFSWHGKFNTEGNIYLHFTVNNNNELKERNTANNTYTTTINVKAEEKLNEIEKINKRSENLLFGKIDSLLSEINELRSQVREQKTQIKYLQNLTLALSKVSVEMQTAINTFITYGVDDNTHRLGEGERAAVINSFKSAYGNLPNTEEELSDVIKIANGRWPSKTNINADNRAKEEFRNIYKREANMNNSHDNAAVTIMAYGLRQRAENRNLSSESAGLNTFRHIYGRLPQSTEDWNILQAITYSGATR